MMLNSSLPGMATKGGDAASGVILQAALSVPRRCSEMRGMAEALAALALPATLDDASEAEAVAADDSVAGAADAPSLCA